MRERVLDTNRLIVFWRRCENQGRTERESPRALGAELAELEGTTAIVSPVYLEFLCGARSGEDLRRYREFLTAFDVVDEWDIRKEDWEVARRRVERSGSPRMAVRVIWSIA